ncbi:MAG: hypothetical protein ACRCSG_03380 [Cellulosilyticaceae bacterium]
MKKNTKQKKQNISFVEGTLPTNKRETFDWEKKSPRIVEPWHLTTVALLINVMILLMYFFVMSFVEWQVTIGMLFVILNIILIVLSYVMLYKKQWSLPITRFTKMINVVAICITSIVLVITLILVSFKNT